MLRQQHEVRAEVANVMTYTKAKQPNNKALGFQAEGLGLPVTLISQPGLAQAAPEAQLF